MKYHYEDKDVVFRVSNYLCSKQIYGFEEGKFLYIISSIELTEEQKYLAIYTYHEMKTLSNKKSTLRKSIEEWLPYEKGNGL